jgi:hypothetical protein
MEINAIVNRQTALVNVQSKQLSTFHIIESTLAKQQREIDAQVNATQLLFHTVIKLYLDRFGPNATQLAEHVHWQHQYLRAVTLFQDTVMEFHHAIDRAEDVFSPLLFSRDSNWRKPCIKSPTNYHLAWDSLYQEKTCQPTTRPGSARLYPSMARCWQ